jgi:hypothetical protein
MALKTTKRIWYGNPAPQVDSGQKDKDGKPVMMAGPISQIYDKRIKDIKAGSEIPDDVDLQDHIATRMLDDGHLVDEVPLEVQLALRNEAAEKAEEADKARAAKAAAKA